MVRIILISTKTIEITDPIIIKIGGIYRDENGKPYEIFEGHVKENGDIFCQAKEYLEPSGIYR